MQLKGIIFDLDGTLAETWPICFVAFRNAFIQHSGQHYSDPEIEAMFGPDEEGIIKRRVPDDWEAAVETYLDEYERAHTLCETPFPGIDKALSMLKERGVKLAVVTGKGMGSAVISLERLKLDHYFDMVEPGHPSGGIKPIATQKVLKSWGFDPQDVAYLGDAPSDVDGAYKAGVLPLSAAWSSSADIDKIRERKPSAIFREVQDFIEWIEANTTRK